MSEQGMWDTYFGLAVSGYLAARTGNAADLLDPAITARDCAEIADAMMAERGKRFGAGGPAHECNDSAFAARAIRLMLDGGQLNPEGRQALLGLAIRLEGKR